jgi:hypothetical protein
MNRDGNREDALVSIAATTCYSVRMFGFCPSLMEGEGMDGACVVIARLALRWLGDGYAGFCPLALPMLRR